MTDESDFQSDDYEEPSGFPDVELLKTLPALAAAADATQDGRTRELLQAAMLEVVKAVQLINSPIRVAH